MSAGSCGTRKRLGVLSHPFLGEGSPSKIDYRKKGTLILTSLLEDLESDGDGAALFFAGANWTAPSNLSWT